MKVNNMRVNNMKIILATLLLTIAGSAYSHGDSGALGEWLPIAKHTADSTVMAQIQSSPLGNEILVEYKGAGYLEILADDGEAFLRISKSGVEGNWDHPAFYQTQVAGERPLPEWVKDGVIEPVWKPVSDNAYWGWYDARLEKQNDNHEQWIINVRTNGERSSISGRFKSLTAPKYRTLVTLDRKNLAEINNLSAMIISDVQAAIRLSYKGKDKLIVLDEDGEPMFRFSPAGIEARIASRGWQQLGRLPLTRETEWVKLSSQPAYSWPDSRLDYSSEVASWSIPLISDSNSAELQLLGSWIKVKSPTNNDGITHQRSD
jgi:hypothetical protein